MKRMIFFFGVFFLFAGVGYGQEKPLNMIVNQNLVVPGQEIWYGIAQNEALAKKDKKDISFPSVYVILYDLTGRVLNHIIYSEKNVSFTGKMRIPESITPGTYILSATIYDHYMSKILVEESVALHVLGNSGTSYYEFTKLGDCPLKRAVSNNEPTLDDCLDNLEEGISLRNVSGGLQDGHLVEFEREGPCGLVLQRANKIANEKGELAILHLFQGNLNEIHKDKSARNNICFDQIIDATTPMIGISKADNFAAYSALSYFSTEVNWLYDFGMLYFVPDKYRLPGFFHSGAKRIYQLKKFPEDINYMLRIPNSFGEQKGQFIDVMTYANIKEGIVEKWLDPIWKCGSVSRVELNSSTILAAKESISKSQIIQSIFKNELMLSEKKIYNVAGVTPDDRIDLSVYQPFESMRLFFVEASAQIRVIKGKNGLEDIKMQNLDTRNVYPGSPTLLVNGVIQEKSSDVFDIPYNEVDSISLYRKLSTTRNNFGALARNGVIDIHTKPGIKPKVSPIILSCLTEGQAFQKSQIKISEDDTQPYLSQTQFIGKPKQIPFCYQHNDENGVYMVQIMTSSGVKNYYFGVGSGMDE